MKTKLCFNILCIFLLLTLGYSSTPPENTPPPVNNNDEDCNPCSSEETHSYGSGVDGQLLATAAGKAWKENADFKWRSTSIVMNPILSSMNVEELKGDYSLFYEVPHIDEIVKINRDDVIDVNADITEIGYADTYEGEFGAGIAVQSTKPFANQNAISEVGNIISTSIINGRPKYDSNADSEYKYRASADLIHCQCSEGEEDGAEDGNGDDGADAGDDSDNTDDSSNTSGSTSTPLLADTSTRTLSPGRTSHTYATVGTTHYASMTSSIPYASVVWQVDPPGHSGNTIPVVETDTGDGSLTEATLSYTFPSGVAGTYKIMAYVWYSDLSARQMSYDVRVILEPGLRPINGSSYYANGGDTYEMGLVTNAPYSRVEWYMKPAGDTSPDGAKVETDYAVGTTTEAELSHALPNGTPGYCTITAHVFNSDDTNYKVTYNVYVY